MFINIGFGNIVNTDRVLSIVRPDAAPVKRLVSNAKAEGEVIDATQGRRTKAVIVLDNDKVLLSALQPETIVKRMHQELTDPEETEVLV